MGVGPGPPAAPQAFPVASHTFLFHADLITPISHTPRTLFSPFSLLHRDPRLCPVPLPSLLPSVNGAPVWSTSVELALVPSVKRPCPRGALWRGCPSRLLTPDPAGRLRLTPHPSLGRSSCLLAGGFLQASGCPGSEASLGAPSPAPSPLPCLLPPSAGSEQGSRRQGG